MAIETICHNCGAVYKSDTVEVGGGIRCQRCKSVLTIGADDQVTRLEELPDLAKAAAAAGSPVLGKQERLAAPTIVDSHPQVAGKFTELPPGTIIGKCRIEKELGRGGMGIVYLATHTTLEVPVAVKVLPRQDTGVAIERFLREARLSARISHPNVMQVMDVDQDAETGLYYIVMEYVSGGSVRDLIEKGALSEKEAVAITIGVAKALEAATEFSIIHRDIKPDNLMLTKDHVVKLADLGLAKQLDTDGIQATLTQTIMGTPAYMSLEQAEGVKDIDARADIYSLGATLYHMLVGINPFRGNSAIEVLTKVLSEPTPDPRTERADISAGLAAVCQKMMAKKREDRYPTPGEMLADLRQLAAGKTPRAETESCATGGNAEAYQEQWNAEAAERSSAAIDSSGIELQAAKQVKEKLTDKGTLVSCAQCRGQFRVPPKLYGKSGKCPTCDAPVDFPDPAKVTAAAKDSASSATAEKKVAAKIKARCEHCRAILTLSAKAKGRTIKCPQCKEPTAIVALKKKAKKKRKKRADSGGALALEAIDESLDAAPVVERNVEAFNAWKVLEQGKQDSYWVALWRGCLYPFEALGVLIFFVVGVPVALAIVDAVSKYLLAWAGSEEAFNAPDKIGFVAAGVTAGVLAAVLACLSFFCSFLFAIVRVAAEGRTATPVIEGMHHRSNLAALVSLVALYLGPGIFLGFAMADAGEVFTWTIPGVLVLVVLGVFFPMGMVCSASISAKAGLNPILVGKSIGAVIKHYAYFILVAAVAALIFGGAGLWVNGLANEALSGEPDYLKGLGLRVGAGLLFMFPIVAFMRNVGLLVRYQGGYLPFEVDVQSEHKGGMIPQVVMLIGVLLLFLPLHTAAIDWSKKGGDGMRARNHLQEKIWGSLAGNWSKRQKVPADIEALARLVGGKDALRCPIKGKYDDLAVFYNMVKLTAGEKKRNKLIWIYEKKSLLPDGRIHVLLLHGSVRAITPRKLNKVLALEAKYLAAESAKQRDSVYTKIEDEMRLTQ